MKRNGLLIFNLLSSFIQICEHRITISFIPMIFWLVYWLSPLKSMCFEAPKRMANYIATVCLCRCFWSWCFKTVGSVCVILYYPLLWILFSFNSYKRCFLDRSPPFCRYSSDTVMWHFKIHPRPRFSLSALMKIANYVLNWFLKSFKILLLV